jgi:hypothetical protein
MNLSNKLRRTTRQALDRPLPLPGIRRVGWVGEFGAAAKDKPFGPAEDEMVRRMLRSIKETGVELSAPWNFPPGEPFQPTHDITPTNERAWLLEEVRKFNQETSKKP